MNAATFSSPGLPLAHLLEPSLVNPVFLPRLRDEAAAFTFVSSTSSEAEHISQRHTQDTNAAGYTDKALPSTAPTYKTCIKQTDS